MVPSTSERRGIAVIFPLPDGKKTRLLYQNCPCEPLPCPALHPPSQSVHRGLGIALARKLTSDYILRHVREAHQEQRPASRSHRRWHERARGPPAKLPAAGKRGAEPGPAGHPPQSQ